MQVRNSEIIFINIKAECVVCYENCLLIVFEDNDITLQSGETVSNKCEKYKMSLVNIISIHNYQGLSRVGIYNKEWMGISKCNSHSLMVLCMEYMYIV